MSEPYPTHPKRGELRVFNGVLHRFIERELEGDKWEVLGPDPTATEASGAIAHIRSSKGGHQ